MLKVLSGLPWKTCLVYLDDIMIMGKTFEEHIKNLEEVMQRLRDANLKLNPKKCELFRKEVTFLGHVVSEEGVATNSEKRFICKFAEIARPLHQLTEANQKFHWSDDCQSAFKELKTKLISTPILSYPRDQGLFILDADASNDSMGAVLSQVQDGYEKVICYYSKVFHKAERKYCVTTRELLAVVSSVKQFHHYLYGHHFLVRSDHGALSEYDFEIQHQAGKSHGNADALSRRPCEEIDCNKCCKSEEKYGNENLSLDNESKNTSESLKNNVNDKVVYIVTRSGKTTDNLLSKLSSQTQEIAPKIVRERYTWYNQRKDVEQWCKCCNICASRKPPSKKPKAPPQQYNVGAPFERIGIDILGPLPKSTRGNKFLLVIGDYFTKWMEAIPIQDMEATTVANKLIERIVTIFGVPMEIHSDRGSNFESNVFAEMCKILGINKTRSTPLRPQVMGWSSEHQTTEVSPYEMVFGRQITLPVDMAMGVPSSNYELPTYKTDYAYKLSGRINKIHEFARDRIKMSSDNMKRIYKENELVWLYNPMNLYKCGFCHNFKYNTVFMLERHMLDQHSGFGFQCQECHKVFMRRDYQHRGCKNGEAGGQEEYNLQFTETEEYIIPDIPNEMLQPSYSPTPTHILILRGLNEAQKKRITLNIDGTKFESCAQTLQNDPSSLLSRMLAPDSPFQPYIQEPLPSYF
ncbi:unnamed protein product [Mytilus edulis]|uniref:Uncharacterized protein n=1 Tax=Mytilus edulis TaxID=6550 RepID=A0A8S3R3D0_MYTED|nr:unnamed protein product [Mytilus edulis]